MSSSKKPRNYYVDFTRNRDTKGYRAGRSSNNKRYKDVPDLEFSNTGFLVTAADEVKSYLEIRCLLERLYEQVYGQPDPAEKRCDSEEQIIDDELEKELQNLRIHRPFKQVKTHCKNTLFIKIMDDHKSKIDPVLVVDQLFNNIELKKECQTRNTFKVLPILDTFRNSAACAKESIANLLETKFKDVEGPRKYFIEFQSRGNYKLSSEDKQKMIESVADVVTRHKPDWVVSRDDADFMIVLAALRDVCCATIVTRYFERAKFNVIKFHENLSPPQKNEIVLNGIDDKTRALNSCKEIWKKSDAVCFDVDSTVCCDEAIDELAKYAGKSKEVSEITKSAMMGGANFREALARRLNIIQPSTKMLEQFLDANKPRLTDHIAELVERLHRLKRDVYLVSGGFDVIIQPAAKRLNIPYENIFANSLEFNSDGSYASFDETRPTSNQDGKSRVISMLKQKKGYKNIVMVGDGVTDLEACPPADAFIGFGGNQVRSTVKDNSSWFVYSFEELIKELPQPDTC